MMPAVHHDPNKLCQVTFRHNRQFHSMRGLQFKDRGAAVRWVKSSYRGASEISVVFYVPAEVSDGSK